MDIDDFIVERRNALKSMMDVNKSCRISEDVQAFFLMELAISRPILPRFLTTASPKMSEEVWAPRSRIRSSIMLV